MPLQGFESRIAAAGTTEELWEALRAYFSGTDVQKLVYLHLPPLGAPDSQMPEIRAEGISAELAARYVEERLYRDNPVATRAQRRVEPVYWDDIDEEDLTPGERDFLEEFRAVGLGHGVSLPLYGPDGRRGQGGLGFRDGVRRLEPAVLRAYWQVCELAHLRFCALVLPKLGALPQAVAPGGGGARLGGAGQEQRAHRGHPRDLGGDGRCAPAADSISSSGSSTGSARRSGGSGSG